MAINSASNGVMLLVITNGYLLVCDLQEWSSKGSKMRSSLATKDVVKSEV